MSIKKVLVPVDFSPASEHTATYALQLCQHLSATPCFLHVIDASEVALFGSYTPWQPVSPPNQALDLAKKEMDHFIDKLKPEMKIENRSVVTGDTASEAIAAEADKGNFDLIVISTHGRSGMGRFFLGSVAGNLLAVANKPVITVNQSIAERMAYRPIKQIMHPTDFSKEAEKAGNLAASLCDILDAKLNVFHVADVTSFSWFYGHPTLREDDLKRAYHQEIEKRLNEYAAKWSVKGSITKDLNLTAGSVPKAIGEEAKKSGADLVVMATHQHSILDKMIIGSVAERVVRMAECPVLTLK